MKTRITNIKWDTDEAPVESLGLPTSIELDVPFESTDDDFYDYIDNYLSDTYGYCFFGYSLE